MRSEGELEVLVPRVVVFGKTVLEFFVARRVQRRIGAGWVALPKLALKVSEIEPERN